MSLHAQKGTYREPAALKHDLPHDKPFESFRKRFTAAQCREHCWLARKTNTRTRTEKEVVGLAEAKRNAFIENRSPIVGIVSDNKDELDVTKDNLRLFVERWREHPDSPYTIDTYYALPRNPARERDESVSLRAHSPSPCDSLPSSSAPSEKVLDSVRDYSSNLLSVPSLSLSLERRASEGTAMRNRRDPASQIALAEEIIKLSEHLRAIAMGSQTSEEDADESAMSTVQHSAKKKLVNIGNTRGTYAKSSAMLSVSHNESEETNEITEKLSNITRQRKLNGTTFHSNRSFDKHMQDTNSGNVFVALRKTSISDSETSERRKDRKYSVEQSSMISETIEEKFNGETTDKRTSIQQASSISREEGSKEIDLTPPWRHSRVKRSFGETSRDVPRISNLRDLHKNLNLDEPSSAKDLLLHLLGEWDEVTTTPCAGAGRKSVSLDWCAGDSVARRTMNSLAEYFQSKQQEAQPPDHVASSTSPSIHR